MESDRKHHAFTLEELQGMQKNLQAGMYVFGVLTSNIERTEVTLNETSSTLECTAILSLLSLVSRSTSDNSDIIRLLSLVRNSKFLKENLVSLLRAPHTPDDDVGNVCNIINNSLELLMQLSLRLPSSIVDTFGLISIIKTKIQEILPLVGKSLKTDMLNASENVSELQGRIIETLQTKNQPSATENCFDDKAPPDDFHDIPILPRASDIFLSSRVFLRTNKSRGGYANLQEYLDVQFRLYREDCIRPLREGITEYVRQHSTGRRVAKLEEGRLYRHVIASNPKDTNHGLIMKVTLKDKHSKTIRWKTSQRLLYGSLLCLSPDHFQTMYFAVVAESDRDTLANDGSFSVQMATRRMCPLSKSLTMLESTAYYESYRHVLSALKNIKDGDLPFEKYIVHCINRMELPKYIHNGSKIYDFGPLISNHVMCKTKNSNNVHQRVATERKVRNVNVLSPFDQWPTPEELHLDESQFKAFHSALTQEFVLIQGPPGTGKTYVGLQIAKTLLHNKEIWYERRPMLVVCYTNHALDQFLEGLVAIDDKSRDEWRQGIVRVGEQYNSQVVEQFALKNKRHLIKYRVDEETYANRLKEMREEIVQIRWRVQQTKTSILSMNILSPFICMDHRQSLCKGKSMDRNVISNWLGCSESHWIRLAMEEILDRKPIITQESDVQQIIVDAATNAQKADDKRPMEEEDYGVSAKYEDVGLNIKYFLKEILFKYQNENFDERFKDILNKKASDALRSSSSSERMSEKDVGNMQENLWKISSEKRWSLYRYWVHKYIQTSIKELETIQSDMKHTYKEYQRELQERDAIILKEATVVAMTTTGAARYHDVLNEIAPRIVIVEEATEVLEAHIVTSLSSKCEHLILIGDHKQLEPKPTVYELAVKYNLGVSMFERMINNGLSFHCLQRQYRMRPEIATLVRHIYPNLIDNENVFNYERVKGVRKDVFFITHNEQEQYRDDIRSYSNEHEARYIMRLCKYLMLQGYSASQITVLVAYNGQMFCIRDLMPREDFYWLRVSAIDNYQGEENDIILVSLVRSNTEGKIGFLGRDNRVCVTLSRAKKGMYVIGNFSIFEKASSLWKKVLHDVREMESFGDSLPLYCQNHPDRKGIKAKNPEDFEEGCHRRCDFNLPCDHRCVLKCHLTDSYHRKYLCIVECGKECPNGHICKKKCHYGSDCTCKVQMQKTLSCNHTQTVACSENINDVKCRHEVQRTLELCGHEALMECYEHSDRYRCQKTVTRSLAKCGHDATMECYQDPTRYECQKIITFNLDKCGHVATLKCYLYSARYECKIIVTRTLEKCGHSLKMECHRDPSSVICKELVIKKRSCGHEYKRECYRSKLVFEMSLGNCEEFVFKELNCGHSMKVKCFEKNTKRLQCRETISKLLACGHSKNMKCFKSAKGAICTEIVQNKLPKCDHVMKMECKDDVNKKVCQETTLKTLPSCGHRVEMICSDTNFHSVKCREIVTRLMPDCRHAMEIRCYENVNELKCNKYVSIKQPYCGHSVRIACSVKRSNQIKFPICCEKVTNRLPCKPTKQAECYNNNNSNNEIQFKAVCKATLACGHKCTGQCKDCIRSSHSRCHRTRVCGHPCTGFECGACTPCQGICEMYCPHADCNHSCGKPCTHCTKRCTWSCPHFTCTKNCDEECDRPRCTKRCPKKLSCEHQCPGFCGEPCPQTCRDCTPTVWAAFFGSNKVVDDGVFIVRLLECNHEFISTFLDDYFDDLKTASTLKLACCPTCKCVIRWHPRYGTLLREQRGAQQVIMKLINKYNKQQIVLKPNFHDIVSYMVLCNTILLSQQILNQENQEGIKLHNQYQTTLSMLSNLFLILDSVKLQDMSCQVIHDTYNRMYLIAAQWLLIIAMTKSLEEENDDISDDEADVQTQTEKQSSVSLFSEKRNTTKAKRDHPNKTIHILSVKKMLDGLSAIAVDDLEKVQYLLSPHVTDVGQLAAATRYPVFEGVPGVHIDDWKICKKGHVEPSSSHRKVCIHCEFRRSPELETFLRNVPKYEIHISQNMTRIKEVHEKGQRLRSRKEIACTDDASLRQRSKQEREKKSVPDRRSNREQTPQKHKEILDLKQACHGGRPENFRPERFQLRRNHGQSTHTFIGNSCSDSPKSKQNRTCQPVRELGTKNKERQLSDLSTEDDLPHNIVGQRRRGSRSGRKRDGNEIVRSGRGRGQTGCKSERR